jgi:hypothetical protein
MTQEINTVSLITSSTRRRPFSLEPSRMTYGAHGQDLPYSLGSGNVVCKGAIVGILS